MALFLVASCSYSLRCLPSPAISSNSTSVSTSRAYVICKWHPPPGFVFTYFPLCLLSPLSSLWRHTPLTCIHQNLSLCFSTPLRQRGFSPLLSVFLSSALISLITIIMLCRIQYLPNLKGLQGRRWWCRVLQLPSRRLLWLLPLCGNQWDLPS